MQDRDKKTELLVGLFLLIGLLLMGLLVLQFSSVRELFKGTYTLTVTLPDGTGMKEGTPVMLGGSKIGKVSDKPALNPEFTGVIIPLEIYQKVQIPDDAKFRIGTAGLLGDKFIEIKPSGKPATKYKEPNSVIKGEPANSLEDTAKQVGDKVDLAIKDVQASLVDLRTSLKKINDGVLSDESTKDLKETFKHLNAFVTRLDEKTFTDQTSNDLKEAVASFKSAAKILDDSVKKMEPAFGKVEGVINKADRVMTSAESAVKSFDKTAANLGEVTKDIRNGGGLFPAMLRDEKLKAEFQSLITNMRQHGILFYRDDTGKVKRSREEPTSGRAPYTGQKR